MSHDLSIDHIELSRFITLPYPDGTVMDYEKLRVFTRRVGEALCGAPGRILVDGRGTPKDYTFADAYRLVDEFKDEACFRSGRVAILNDYELSFEKTQSVAYHSQEAGLTVKAFVDYDRAAAWLLEDDAAPL